MMTNSTEVYIIDQGDTTEEQNIFNFKQRVAVSVMYSVIFITGITGNACVILAVLLSKKLHTLTNIMVVNLSVTDFLTCCTLPIQVVVLLNSDQTLQVVPYPLCVLASAVNFVGMCNSLTTLSLIAFMRWHVITRSIRGHRGFHTPGKISAMVATTWTFSLVSMLLPPGLGLGTLGYSVIYKQCSTTDDNPLVMYYSMIQGVGTVILVTCAVCFYIAIFLFVHKNNKKFTEQFRRQDDPTNVRESKTNLRKECTTESDNIATSPIQSLSYMVENGHHQNETEHRLAARFREREMRVTKNLFMVFCIFLVCVFPFAISLAIPGGGILHIYFIVLIYLNVCVNPVVYCLKHDQFKQVLRPMLCCKWSKIPQPTKFLRRCFPRSADEFQMSSITSNR